MEEHERTWWGWISGSKRDMRKQLFRGVHRIRVDPSPEPADVLWENLQYGALDQFLRARGTDLLTLLLLLTSFLTIAMLTSLANQFAQQLPDAATCNVRCGISFGAGGIPVKSRTGTVCTAPPPPPLPPPPPPITLAQLVLGSVQNYSPPPPPPPLITNPPVCTPIPSDCIECYCHFLLQADAQALLIGSDVAYCSAYTVRTMISIVLAIGSSIGINIINIALYYVLQYSVAFEKHHSISANLSSFARKNFIAQVINTVAVLVIVGTNLPDLQAALLKYTGPSLSQYILNGTFSDLIPLWYAKTGRAIFITIAMGPIINRASHLLSFVYRWLALRGPSRAAAVNQRELNKLYNGPQFPIAERYGEALAMLFSVIIFSHAMPPMLLVAVVCFISMYYLCQAASS